MGGHEDELVEAAVFEVDFAKPAERVDVEKSRFFADFADGGLFGGFPRFDVALGDGPAVFAVLDEEDFDVLLVLGEAKNNAAGGWLADNLLDNRLFSKDGFLELVDWGGLVLFRKGFRNFKVTSLSAQRRFLRGAGRSTRRRLSVLIHGFALGRSRRSQGS